MTVGVRLFAGLNKYIPGLNFGETLRLELPAEAVIETLIRNLGLPEEIKLYFLVNGQVKTCDSPLMDGDLIDIFPPVGGG